MLQTDNNMIVLREKRPFSVYEGIIQSKPTLIGDFVEREKIFSLFNLEKKYTVEYPIMSISFRELWLFNYKLNPKTITI